MLKWLKNKSKRAILPVSRHEIFLLNLAFKL
jgi:hypothetical protein